MTTYKGQTQQEPTQQLGGKQLGSQGGASSIRFVGGPYEKFNKPKAEPSTDYLSRFGKPTEAGATQWGGVGDPSALYYSPTGSDWQSLTEQNLSDPAAWSALQTAAATTGMGQSAFQDLLNKAPESVKDAAKAREGSSFSLSPEVISKMWT